MTDSEMLRRRSPRQLVGLPEPEVGEAFTTVGGRKSGTIVAVDLGKQLTGTIMGAYLSYVLVPQEHDMTRLLLKVVMQTSRWVGLGLSIGDLVMARRQLLNLKQLTERQHHQARCQPTGSTEASSSHAPAVSRTHTGRSSGDVADS